MRTPRPTVYYARRANRDKMISVERYGEDLQDSERREARDNQAAALRRSRPPMLFATRGRILSRLVSAIVAAFGMITSTAAAGQPPPEQILRDSGLVQSGAGFFVKGQEDVSDRVAEIGRLVADWKHARAGLNVKLERLGRMQLQYDELTRKLRALDEEQRLNSKAFRPGEFLDNGPRGPGSGPPRPGSGPFRPGSGPPPPPDDMNGFGPGSGGGFRSRCSGSKRNNAATTI